MILTDIVSAYEGFDILKADGFDSAVMGIDTDLRLIYSVTKCIQILVDEQGMSRADAEEYFMYNVKGSYVGEQTPIWCEDSF